MKERTEGDYGYSQSRKRVEEYLDEIAKGNVIVDIWMLDDVKSRALDNDIELTDDQCRDVLSYLTNKHDANIGINWEVMDYWIEEVVKEEVDMPYDYFGDEMVDS